MTVIGGSPLSFPFNLQLPFHLMHIPVKLCILMAVFVKVMLSICLMLSILTICAYYSYSWLIHTYSWVIAALSSIIEEWSSTCLSSFFQFGIKGSLIRDFRLQFFSWISVPQAPEYSIRIISTFFFNSPRKSWMNVYQQWQWPRR